jgi:hypothetical protein
MNWTLWPLKFFGPQVFFDSFEKFFLIPAVVIQVSQGAEGIPGAIQKCGNKKRPFFGAGEGHHHHPQGQGRKMGGGMFFDQAWGRLEGDFAVLFASGQEILNFLKHAVFG